MTVRSDITIDFTLSPRIITVASPSTTVTIQDLHDTLRNEESRIWNMSFNKVVSSFGKQSLGSGTSVGITMVLQDSKLAFAARAGPSYIQCTVTGGNLLAVDANAVSMDPISPTAFTQIVVAQSASATRIQDTAEWTAAEKTNVTNKVNTMTPQMNTVYNIQYGKWKIVSNQLLMYDPADGVTVIRTFNLFDKDGNPAEVNVTERRPV